MEVALILAVVMVCVALIFDFTNGFNDSANQVATVITSNAIHPALALTIAAFGNFIGAYFLGTAVAGTIGQGIIDPRLFSSQGVGVLVVISALVGAIVWNFITWRFGIPSSSSHALIGGLLGAFIAAWGFAPIKWFKVLLIIVVMIVSPVIGFVATYIFTRITSGFSKWLTPSANNTFKKMQYITLSAQALSHGTNDAQKTMGVITFGLVFLGFYSEPMSGAFIIPRWVILLCSLAIATGTITGGWRIIKTLGAGLYRVRPIHAFASQAASSLIIYITAAFGYPISTTQVISSSVMGAGSAFRPKMIRWGVASDMVFAWFITIPLSAAVAATFLLVIKYFFA